MTAKWKREYVRLSVNILVEFVVQNRVYQGWIKDIGEGGMVIDANGPFSIGQDISMIYLSPRGLREKRTGKISRTISQGIGVKFSLPGYSR